MAAPRKYPDELRGVRPASLSVPWAGRLRVVKWRFWDPGLETVSYYGPADPLPPRRVHLTHLRHIGDEMKRMTGADSYSLRLTGNAPRDVELAEFGQLLPTEMALMITATGPGPWGVEQSQGEMTLTFSAAPWQPGLIGPHRFGDVPLGQVDPDQRSVRALPQWLHAHRLAGEPTG